MAGGPAAGPLAGEIVQVVGSALDAHVSGVIAGDFVARVLFENPEAISSGRWDYGIAFRQDASGRHWRVIIRSDGTWSLAIAAEPPRATGVVESFDPRPGASNAIELVVEGPRGYLLVNDEFTAMLDLSSWREPGDIWIGSGFFLDHATPGAQTRYSDFTVWGLGEFERPQVEGAATPEPIAEIGEESEPTLIPIEGTPSPEDEDPSLPEATPVASPEAVQPDAAQDAETLASIRQEVDGQEPEFGPEAGTVTQGIGAIDIAIANVAVEDFYTAVRFSNPSSPTAPDHSWDVVIGFWHTGGDNQVRVVVASDGSWSAAEGTARPIVNGSADSILLGPARGNDIELAVRDGVGYLAINGEFVARFDVPGTPRPGDIWIASGTFPENVQQGIVTPFSGWTVWTLEGESSQ
jgi:hypothetical protein